VNNKQYLDFLRQKNKEIMSKCYYCDGFAITIRADGYAIYPVCKNHIDERDLQNEEENINEMFEQQRDFE
jgi:hypothetical protein